MTEMSGARSMRSWQEFERSMRNFDWLQDAVPGAMDLDFLIERRGRFLVLEFKPWSNGVNVGFGQHIALEALTKLDTFEVYLVGESDKSKVLHVMEYGVRSPVKNGTRPVWFPPGRFNSTTKDGMRDFVQSWFAEASSLPRAA